MTRILVVNGPNLGALGRREPGVYGATTLAEISAKVEERARALGVDVRWEQTNHEGAIVDLLEQEAGGAAGCVINPGALSHYSVAVLDAMRGFPGPIVEVHLSNVFTREPYRRVLVTAEGADGVVAGLGPEGYLHALDAVVKLVNDRSE